MSPEELRRRIGQIPRIQYGTYPTPLEPLTELTVEMAGPQLWIKRDDIIGPGMGGNKGRKLEFLIAEALAQGRKKVVTYGGLQSNHARMTAAACARHGLEAHLFFFERRPEVLEGNLLLDNLFNAHLHFIPIGGGGGGSMTIETTSRLVRLASKIFGGRGAYFIPVGGHNMIGCLGYVLAAIELEEQIKGMKLDDGPITLVMAAGTGSTLAGLMAGFSLLDSPIRLMGIDVGKLWKAFPASIARLAGDICKELGQPTFFRANDVPIIEERYVGPGYGVHSSEAKAAIRTLGRHGIILDPIYTGKAFAGVLDMIRTKKFRPVERVIFLHTGGYPGLFTDQLIV
jgi:D-cysteine desulfhydrase family pyridoxal phosphate-dependent enzyme